MPHKRPPNYVQAPGRGKAHGIVGGPLLAGQVNGREPPAFANKKRRKAGESEGSAEIERRFRLCRCWLPAAFASRASFRRGGGIDYSCEASISTCGAPSISMCGRDATFAGGAFGAMRMSASSLIR